MFTASLPQGCHCCFFPSLPPIPAAEFTASSFASPDYALIARLSGRNKTHWLSYTSRGLIKCQRGKALNHSPTVFTAHFPPCSFYLFHTWESHSSVACVYYPAESCPSSSSATCCYLFPINWIAHMSNKLNPSFFPLPIHLWNCNDDFFFSSDLLTCGARHAPHFGDISRFHKNYFVFSHVMKGHCTDQGGQCWKQPLGTTKDRSLYLLL